VSRRLAALLAGAALLVACAKPIPAEHRELVGHWEGPGMVLQISADGRLAYKRHKAGGNVSIDAPIQELGASGFSAGVGPLTTQFKLDRAPRLDNGAWTMTVDGVVLVRRPDTGPAPVDVER
jgi:hypothetical protein